MTSTTYLSCFDVISLSFLALLTLGLWVQDVNGCLTHFKMVFRLILNRFINSHKSLAIKFELSKAINERFEINTMINI